MTESKPLAEMEKKVAAAQNGAKPAAEGIGPVNKPVATPDGASKPAVAAVSAT